MRYRLSLLGRPALKLGPATVPLRSRKGQALLWYLAAQPHESYDRPHLQDLLWHDVPRDVARRDFNTMFYRLRNELPVPFIVASRSRLQWNAQVDATIDVQHFTNVTKHVVPPEQPASARTLQLMSDEDRHALYDAISLYEGPFLDGFSCASEAYEQWMNTKRLQWEGRIFDVLDALIRVEAKHGRWEYVTQVARRALEIDPLHEPFHRAAMRAFVHQGHHSAALAQFETCRAALLEQLGAEPDELTSALYATIKAAGAGQTDIGAVTSPSKARPGTTLLLPTNIGALPTPAYPFVGRTHERERMQTTLRSAMTDRRNHAVLLYGEAGIGKTRLVTEFVDAATTAEFRGSGFGTLLLGRAYETMADVPYAIFGEALEGIVHSVDVSSLGLSDTWLRELHRLLPGLPLHDSNTHVSRPHTAGGHAPHTFDHDDQLRLFQAVARFIGALPQPVLLVMDDIHWADPSSLALMDYLLRRAPDDLHLALLATARAGDESDAAALMFTTLARERLLTRIEPEPLSEANTTELIGALDPHGVSLHAGHIFSQAKGHPLYTVELFRMWHELEHHQSPQTANPNGYASDESSTPLPVPPTVQDIFVGRVTRLGDVATTVGESLAIFRDGASFEQLLHVAGIPEADVVAGLDALVTARIVTETGDGAVAFKHDVFSQVMLKRLSGTRRSYLHRRAYASLSTRFSANSARTQNSASFPSGSPLPSGQHVSDLIVHAIGGRLWDEAVRWTEVAADAARQLYAFPTAVEKLRQMLACLDRLPDTRERRLRALDVELRIAALDYWSTPTERDARVATVIERAHAEKDMSLVVRGRIAQVVSYVFQGRCKEATAILDSLTPVAATEPRLAIRLRAARAAIDCIVGDIKQAIEAFDCVLRANKEQVFQPGTSLYAGSATCYASLGDMGKADAALAALAREETEQGYEGLTRKYFTVAATVEYIRGEWEAVAKLARRGIDSSRTANDPYNEALSTLWLGAALTKLGAAEDAIQMLHIASATLEKTQIYTRRDFIQAFLAEAYIHAGQSKHTDHTEQAHRYERADAAVTTGIEIAERFGYKEGYALLKEMQGRLAAARSTYHEAREEHADAERERRLAIECFTDSRARFDSLSIVAGSRRCRNELTSLQRLDATSTHSNVSAAPDEP